MRAPEYICPGRRVDDGGARVVSLASTGVGKDQDVEVEKRGRGALMDIHRPSILEL